MVMYEIIVFPKMRIFKDISKPKYIVKLFFIAFSVWKSRIKTQK